MARNGVSNNLNSLCRNAINPDMHDFEDILDSLCRNVIHPDMHDFEIRLDTFLGWYGEAYPEELAADGLFYTGVRDCVKCWYCNGCLRCWE